MASPGVTESAFLIVFCLAFSITLLATPIIARIGHRYGIVSMAGGRRRNEGDLRGVPKTGGIAIYLGFTVAAVAAQYLHVPRFDDAEIFRLTGLLIGSSLIMLLGVIDDIHELNPVQLGTGQILAAAIAVAFHIFIEQFNNPISGSQIDIADQLVVVTLSLFWMGLMMNAVNFMDGLDGLASGIAFIAGTMLFINSAFVLEQTSVSLLPLALMGASLGFLLHNFYPARVFMGGGAIYLGYLLGTLSIIGGAKMATILLVMGLPLMDLAWQVANRLMQGRNPMHGDRGHIHFRLLDMGFTQRQIVVMYYLFCACFGVLTLVTASRLFKFIALGTMLALIAVGFYLLTKLNHTESSTSS